MSINLIELCKQMCLLNGVSGWEDEVQAFITQKSTPFATEIHQDVMGNIIVFKKGKKAPKQKLMLAAHMDEVGLMVTSANDNGTLRFAAVGYIDTKVLLGKRVKIGDISGVIGLKPMHLIKANEMSTIPAIDNLCIDIGEKSDKLLGSVVVFDSPPVTFGNNFIKAKAIDDRIGCAVLLTLLQQNLENDCYFVFTVQEEVGTRGAFAVTNAIKPDVALIVEATTAADRPDMKPHRKVCSPANGIVIPFMDGGSITDKSLFDKLTMLCEQNNIKWQTKEYVSGGTDAAAIQRSISGVRTIGIAAAVRYIHSPVCVANISDCEDLLTAAQLFVNSFN